MPKVFNWQIGREMDYPFEEARPEKQLSMVFDTNKCIACQTCTIACKMTWTSGRGQEYMFWNNVETKPYGGYPNAWDRALLKKLGPGRWTAEGEYTGQTVFEAADGRAEKIKGILPSDDDWANPNHGEDLVAGGTVDQGMYIHEEEHPLWFFYLPRICNHCSFPACLAACPRGAIYKRQQDGVVLIDQSRCRGYRECVKACPYGKPMFRPNHETSEKCVGCFPKLEKGLNTQCVEGCIGKLRGQGWISDPGKGELREDHPMDYLVHVRKMALPLYPQFGTQPNIYYIPPVHVPAPFLHQLFGPGVEHAIKEYKKAAQGDEELAGLLLLFGSTPFIIDRFEVRNGVAKGWSKEGRLLATVPVTEPTTVREHYDKDLDVYRMDIT